MGVAGASSSRKRKAPPKPQAGTPQRKSTRITPQDAISESRGEYDSETEVNQEDVVVEVTPMSNRTIIQETILDKEFLIEHQLEEVLDLLKAQHWDHMFCDEVVANEDAIKEFYQSLVVQEQGNLMTISFTVNGTTEGLSSRDLGNLLLVPSKGYEEYVKTVWPADVCKSDVIQRVGDDPTNNSTQGDALKLGIVKRTLHRLLCTSITPRKQRHGKISYLDFLLLDKILSKEQVNLPKLIIRHMHFCKTNSVHALPYPGIVKKILVYVNLYKFSNERTVTIVLNYDKLSWKYDYIEGWLYKPEKEQQDDDEGILGGKAEVKVKVEEDSGSSVTGLLTQIVEKMDSMEKLFQSALARDSTDRVNLAASIERNTSLLAKFFRSVEIEREKKEKAAAALDKGKAIVAAGPVVDVPVKTTPSPVDD